MYFFQIVHIIVIIYKTCHVKITLNTILSTQLQRYLLFKNKKHYSIYHKLNGSLDGFVFISINIIYLFS
jgi:hypothetical protein